jgi:inhibitor of cysteine peptidase
MSAKMGKGTCSMRNLILFIVVLALMVISLMACASTCRQKTLSDMPAPEETPPTGETGGFIIRQAGIEGIEIQLLEPMPVQVNVLVRGYLSDGCTRLDQITQEREGSDFSITITTKRPAELNCTQVIVPFQETIPLDVRGLTAGTYTVTVNRMSEAFTLDADNLPQK